MNTKNVYRLCYKSDFYEYKYILAPMCDRFNLKILEKTMISNYLCLNDNIIILSESIDILKDIFVCPLPIMR